MEILRLDMQCGSLRFTERIGGASAFSFCERLAHHNIEEMPVRYLY